MRITLNFNRQRAFLIQLGLILKGNAGSCDSLFCILQISSWHKSTSSESSALNYYTPRTQKSISYKYISYCHIGSYKVSRMSYFCLDNTPPPHRPVVKVLTYSLPWISMQSLWYELESKFRSMNITFIAFLP